MRPVSSRGQVWLCVSDNEGANTSVNLCEDMFFEAESEMDRFQRTQCSQALLFRAQLLKDLQVRKSKPNAELGLLGICYISVATWAITSRAFPRGWDPWSTAWQRRGQGWLQVKEEEEDQKEKKAGHAPGSRHPRKAVSSDVGNCRIWSKTFSNCLLIAWW